MNKLITTFVAATLAMGAAFAQTPATTSSTAAATTVKSAPAKEVKAAAAPVAKKASLTKAAVETAPVK